ncbi:MAG: fimbrillin family protein [Proteiniphilum sp.]|nr:fimbrillin family protein [Proteiniphilum sp.]
MKTKNLFFLFFMGVVMLISCESEVEYPENPLSPKNQVIFQGTIGATVTTRATGTSWNASDSIGVYALHSGETLPTGIYHAKENIKFTTPGDGIFTAATDGITFPETGNLDFIAYYPFQATITGYSLPVDVSNQTNPSAIDLLYSNNAKGASATNATVALQFSHMLSKLVLNLTAGDGISSLTGLTASLAGVKTEGSMSLTNGIVTAGTTTTAITPVIALSGTTGTATAILLPGDDLANATITFTLGGKTYEWNPATQATQSGKKYSYSLVFSATGLAQVNPTATIIDWEEASTGTGDIVLTPEEDPVFTTDKTSSSLAATGTLTDIVQLTTQAEQTWSAASSGTWLTVAPVSGTGSGSITLTAEANNSTAERTATVTITAGGTTSFSPITINVTQAGGEASAPTATLLFPGSDFENWTTFLGSLNSYGLSGDGYASQSLDGGIDGSKALYLNGTPSKNDYVFTALTPEGFSLEGKTKIVLHIKGTANSKTLSFNVYKPDGTYFPFNLGECTGNMILEASTSNSYTGNINTGGNWAKITLNIGSLTIQSTAGENLFALKVGKESIYNLMVDHITLE